MKRQIQSGSGYSFINAISNFATHSEPIRKRRNYKESLFARTGKENPMIDRLTSGVGSSSVKSYDKENPNYEPYSCYDKEYGYFDEEQSLCADLEKVIQTAQKTFLKA